METETVTCDCGLPVAVVKGESAMCADCAKLEELRGESLLEDLGDRQRHLRSVGETDSRGNYYQEAK